MPAKRILVAATFFGCAFFMAVSFVSYDGVSPPSQMSPFSNLGGQAGMALAALLLEYFGAGAFVLAFFLLFIGYSVLVRRAVTAPVIKCLGALFLALSFSTALQAVFPTSGYARSPFLLGGIIGDVFSSKLLIWFGALGTGLILCLSSLAALVLATDTFLVELARGIPEILRDLGRLRPRFRLAFLGPTADTNKSGRGSAKTKSKTASRTKAKTKAKAKSKATKPALAELPHIEEPSQDEFDWEDDEDEDEEEVEALLEDEEEIDDFEDIEEDEEDEDAEPDEEEVEPVVSAPPSEPRIRRGGVKTGGDDIEILQISRAEHLKGKEPYPLPPLSLLDPPAASDVEERDAEIRRKAHKLEETLATFGIDGRVVEISRGPTITVYEVELAAGTKVKRITSLPDDISMALKAKTIRIVAPIPGKSTVGIEVPNDTREPVCLRELVVSDVLRKKKIRIPLFLGKDASGDPLIEDLTKMPHLLIAGQTGSGKSVCINSVIASLLLTKYPDELRLILIDPKMVELQSFRDVPHLLTPVVTDMKKAPKILDWAVNEMEQRYRLLSAVGVRDIERFNALGEEEVTQRLSEHYTPDELAGLPTNLPYVVVVVDELADLMMTSAKEVETSICRLAQKSRAVGLHVILATQRPSVDVITGLIKSNMPSRISFRVASKIDSRTILDQMGAERLLGMGDMLFIAPRTSTPTRCQAALVTDAEIRSLVRYVKDVGQTEYSRELTQVRTKSDSDERRMEDRDELYEEAVRVVLASQRGSVSMLQRQLEIGYTRAGRLMDFMEKDGIVGAFKGSKAREVLMTLDDWEARREAQTS